VTKKYNVTSAYNHLMSTINNNIVAAHATEFWNKEMPLKVRLFVWRLFRNRLPTMDNLI